MIEIIKKKKLNFLFGITTIIIIFNFFYFVKEQSLNQYADWLINYQGGFVRRGLIGEIFFQIHSLLDIRLDVIVFIFVSLLYVFFYKNLLQLIKNLKLNFLNLLVIFSPLSFLYPVMEEKASGRKDILYLFLLSIIAVNLKKINFNYQKYVIILFSAITIFSHTGFLFLLPAFLIIFFICNSKKSLKIIIREISIIILSLLLFVIVIYNNSAIYPESIKLICNSISDFVRKDCATEGYISTLSWSLQYNLHLKESLWMTKNYNLFYFFAFLISFFPLFFLFYNSKFLNFSKINCLYLFILYLFSTLPLYYLGVDYGRYLHLTYLSSLIIYIVSLKNKLLVLSISKKIFFKNKFRFKPLILFTVIFLYGFTYTIPHCCNNKFKFNYSKLFIKINEKLN